MKAIGKTRAGNMTRLREGTGSTVAQRLMANDVIEHARRRVERRHAMANGQLIQACAPAAMNVGLGYLSEWLELAGRCTASGERIRRGDTKSPDRCAGSR